MIKKKKTKNNTRTMWLVAYISGGVILTLAFILGLVWWNVEGSKTDLENRGFEDRGLPVMEIKLNGVSLEEIDSNGKEIKYENNDVFLYEDGMVNEYSGVRLKGRGNSSWDGMKKPYQIKFNKKINLFGLGKSRKWILLSNVADSTGLRNDIACYLEDMLDMDKKMRGKFIELYVDGDYRGLYYLTHAVEISKNSVDLKDPLGVLVELDNIHNIGKQVYSTSKGDSFTIKDVVVEENLEEAMKSFLEKYNAFEEAVDKKDYKSIGEMIDVESFAKYYLLSEFSVNPDAYWTSFYMYKDGINDRIHAGPAWDFDLSFGNRAWGNWLGEEFYSPNKTMIRKQEKALPLEFYKTEGIEYEYESSLRLSEIVFDLMEIPEFREVVSQIFQERMMGRKRELVKMISREREVMNDAINNNNERWNIETFNEDYAGLLRWIERRYDYFEEMYGNNEVPQGVFRVEI